MEKTLKISAIREGTVIDHIPSNNTFKVAEILGLKEHDNIVTVAMNLPSKKIKKKGIIKVGGKFLSKQEVNKIAIIAPLATLNIIKDYEVKEKIKLTIPDIINELIKCSNPNCITNLEQVPTKFFVVSREPLKVRCNHCERSMISEDIEIK